MNHNNNMMQRKRILLSGGAIAWQPTDIEGCLFWVDGSDKANIYQDSAKTLLVAADGDVIGCWVDKSGNGNDAIQATTAEKPLYKTGIQNSLSVVRFDGVDDRVAALNIFGVASISNMTMFCVQQTDETNSNNRLYGFGSVAVDSQGAQTIHLNPSVDSSLRFDGASIAGSLGHPTAFYIRTTVKTGTTYYDYFDTSTNINGSSQADNGIIDDVYLGRCNGPCDGDIAEVVVYNVALSDNDRALVRNYLNAKWAVY